MSRRFAVSIALGLIAGCGEPSIAPDAAAPDAPDAPTGVPDLQFLADEMADSWLVTWDDFAVNACEVLEGCVGGPGRRKLLRFTTVTANLGTGDLAIGMTPAPRDSSRVFQWSPCHMHHHYADFTSYELVGGAGATLTARKQAFCVEDGRSLEPAGRPRYSCFDQGLSRGWTDTYDREVACQWIDVTDLSPGMYTLRVVVNPLRSLPESSYDNNVFTTEVSF